MRATPIVVSAFVVALLASAAPAPAAADGVVGIATDVGVPDGAAATLAIRAVRPLRVALGLANNLISTGARASVTLLPRDAWFTPSLSVTVGMFPAGDATPLARRISGDAAMSSPALEEVGYSYTSAHAGLEFGRHIATFFIHGGVSRIRGDVRGLTATFAGAGDDMTDLTFTSAPRATIWTASARIGLIVYLQ